jgi:hypothetical protein
MQIRRVNSRKKNESRSIYHFFRLRRHFPSSLVLQHHTVFHAADMDCAFNDLFPLSSRFQPFPIGICRRLCLNLWPSRPVQNRRRQSQLNRRRTKEKHGTSTTSVKVKKYGGFLLSFLFALTPLPSNIFFLKMGTMKCNFFSVFLGFWFGRLISYAVTINIGTIAFSSLADVLASQLQAVIIIDSLGIISMNVLAFINWEKLIQERRIVFIKPKFFSKS